MINLGLVELLRHPGQLEALRKDNGLIPSAVDEICRYHTASAFALRRVALEDVKARLFLCLPSSFALLSSLILLLLPN